ncbi:MAG: sialidase-1 [Saprospiraceae bacterium]
MGFIGACKSIDVQEGIGDQLTSTDFHNHRSNLSNAALRFDQEKTGRIAFLGGSITFNGGWRDSLEQYFTHRFPDTKFEFIRAGISSMGSTPSAFRLERDVLSKGRVDLLFQEAAVNDDTNGRTKKEQLRAIEGIVRNLRNSNPYIDIVLIHFVDPGKMVTYRADKIPDVIQAHESVAQHYNISSINLAKEVTERIDNGEFTWDGDFINLHPSPFGQGIYAYSMIEFLENNFDKNSESQDKMLAHPIPAILTKGAYDNGRLINASEATYEEGWDLDENWIPVDNTGTRDNYHHVPMLISTTPRSQLQFLFTGSTIGIAVAAGQDAGIIEYRIDNGHWHQQNLFTKWSASLHLPWYFTLATDLSDSAHVLELKVAENRDERSIGNACRIRYFFINQ